MRTTALSLINGVVGLLTFVSCAWASDTVSLPRIVTSVPERPAYYWSESPVSGGAELITLFGRVGLDSNGDARADVPLISILRDTLASGPQSSGRKQDPGDDRLRYVWLLTSDKPTLAQRVLSAVPFFYWKVGRGAPRSAATPAMLVDLSQPAHRVWRTTERSIIQWTALDPLAMPVRASSRAYRTNGGNQERMHLEEAITLLRRAPASTGDSGLTEEQIDRVVARLRLAKNTLGGLMNDSQLGQAQDSHDAQRQSTIGRNWELLRTSAERAGLIFEPLRLGSAGENYAVLWFPLGSSFASPGVSLAATWKLLHISNPWTDPALEEWKGYAQTRELDGNGKLLPPGEAGSEEVVVAPLAVYSLTYPRSPLLLIDFRDKLRAKRRALIQRSTEELVSGVLGLSHFANWYYYAGNGIYHFVKSRRGAAVNAGARIDSYAEFRVATALDTTLDPAFRRELQGRTDGVSINPLDVSLPQQLPAARRNYQELLAEADDPRKLPKKLEKDRRAELARFGESNASRIRADALHYLTFTAYTRRAPERDDNLVRLSRARRINSLIQYLMIVSNSGPEPEVTYNPEHIRQSIMELETLVDANSPALIRSKAAAALGRVRKESQDASLRAECSRALIALDPQTPLQMPPLTSGGAIASTVTFGATPVPGAQ